MKEFEVTYILDECREFFGVFGTEEEANEKKVYIEQLFKDDGGFGGVFIKEI